MGKADTVFHWGIYADATAAGLSVLIPIPLVDWLFEQFFRRRMPQSIATRRGRQLPKPVIRELNQGDENLFKTCLLLPIQGLFWLLKKISRKILYFLTIKEAIDQVSFYWHQAFLIDYMLMDGHLESEESALAARRAMGRILETTHRSPLRHLARELIESTSHIGRSIFGALRRFRQGKEDSLIEQKKTQMSSQWAEFTDYFENLAALYDQAYEAERQRQRAEEIQSLEIEDRDKQSPNL